MKCLEKMCPKYWTSDGYRDCMVAVGERMCTYDPYKNDCCLDGIISKKQTKLKELIELRDSLLEKN